MPRRRRLPQSLSPAEQRVLDAFSAGRIPAGRVSAELANARAARLAPPAQVPVAARSFARPQPVVHAARAVEPAPALALAGEPELSRAA